jgi:mannose/cellobiose epimerase-like protein (N-acyl-D-glucosamine 2-epimerase family)
VIIDDHKSWWSQVEALNSLLLMHYLHPESDINYYTYFRSQWLYIDTYLIDHETWRVVQQWPGYQSGK